MITSLTKIISFNGVGKKYPLLTDFWALKEISFEVSSGEILGIIGRNGSGKTTLLNILAGTLSPTEGERGIQGKVLGLFNLGVGFQDELTGRENIFLNGSILGATHKELEEKLLQIIEFSELGNFINMPLGSYSAGMRLRLAFSIVINLDFDILVIDEVLAVGDILFQNKCFERLMDFKRLGKTLVITSQNIELIERLCERAFLLDHGRIIFQGKPNEAAARYRQLLSTQRFFVGSMEENPKMVIENTKKWADDISTWGDKLGTKEAVINKVIFLNRFGFKVKALKSGEPLRVKVGFTVRNIIKEPHFGVALFRKDGVYCYGPNTKFDGLKIKLLQQGKGSFELFFKNVWLAPGEYCISIAIWDEKETLAYDYHSGCYKLIINGKQNYGGLLSLPVTLKGAGFASRFFRNSNSYFDPDIFNAAGFKEIKNDTAQNYSVKLYGLSSDGVSSLSTREKAYMEISFDSGMSLINKYLWVGIYREDNVYCQGIIMRGIKTAPVKIYFEDFALLPGKYLIYSGILDKKKKRLSSVKHEAQAFHMSFDRQDHGTVFLEHTWSLKAGERIG